MNRIRNLVAACSVGVLLVLGLILLERHFLNAAEERGRKSGAAVQQATDALVADLAQHRADSIAQAKLDSADAVAAARFARTDTVYRTARAEIVERYHTDTLVQRFVQQSDSTIGACRDNVLSCELARANAERETARLRRTVARRDTTILTMAHTQIPPPRSCTVPAVAAGIVGVLAGHYAR